MPANPHKALEYLRRASAQECESAYLDLAELLLEEEATQEEGLGWLQKAVDAEVAGARELAEQLLKQRNGSGLLGRLLGRLRQ
jgi:TPR repeat protein